MSDSPSELRFASLVIAGSAHPVGEQSAQRQRAFVIANSAIQCWDCERGISEWTLDATKIMQNVFLDDLWVSQLAFLARFSIQ